MEQKTKTFTSNFDAARPQFESPLDSGVLNGHWRGWVFAMQTARKIRALQNCGYSLLDLHALAKIVSTWYDACTEAMFDGHYSSLDRFLREQADFASQSGFGLEDLLQFLRVCRSAAVEKQNWHEDIVSLVDEVINELLRSLAAKVPWAIRSDLCYQEVPRTRVSPPPAPAALNQPDLIAAPKAPETAPGSRPTERRSVPRVRMQLTIHVSAALGSLQEIAHTRNVSKFGLTFVARHCYTEKSILKVIYPYWENYDGVKPEIPAEVTRVDHLPDGSRAVAIRFIKPTERSSRGK